MFSKIGNFINEVKIELAKVSWSPLKDLIRTTGVVIVVTLILALYIGAIDIGLSRLLAFLIR
jgi:preprotein translocase subunit SecE